MNSDIYTLGMQFSALCNITKPLHNKKAKKYIETHNHTSGSTSSKNGTKYEKDNHNILINTTLNGKQFNTQKVSELGGSSAGKDLKCNFILEKDIGIEIKNTIGAEFIQLDVHKEDNTWCGPRITKRSHPLSVVTRYLKEINFNSADLFYGMMPPLNKTRDDFDSWETNFLKKKQEKGYGTKKEYQWECNVYDFVKDNYRDKGNDYIQIRDYGLYHLGEDKCNFGVPEFKPEKTIIRIRCKRRGKKGCVPSSITMSAWISGLIKSPYSLDNKEQLPPALLHIGGRPPYPHNSI